MNLKILSSFFIFTLIIAIPQAYGQSESGEKINHELLEVTIKSDGKVNVVHKIKNLNEPGVLDFVKGTVSKVKVTNQLGMTETFEMTSQTNGLPILEDQGKLTIEYELADALAITDNVWTLNYRYLETTVFALPESVEFLLVNDRPLYLEEEKRFVCHGCQVILEYSINEPETIEQVTWEEKEFDVTISSFTTIENFEFSQPEKEITFTTRDDEQFVTVIIPLELLWGPYIVLLDEEKIPFHEYKNNGTHSWLNIKPNNSGEIAIIGTTVVPEFSLFLPLAIGFMVIIMVPLVRKINLH